MKPNSENGFGVLFLRKQLLMLCGRKFHVYGKRENAYFHVVTASGKRQAGKRRKWRENYGHVVTFAETRC